MSAKRSIPVQILGHEYRVRSDANEETVRRAATLVDETMGRVRSRTKTVDSLDVAVLAALNIANRLVTRDETAPDPANEAHLRALTDRLEAALAGEGSEPS